MTVSEGLPLYEKHEDGVFFLHVDRMPSRGDFVSIEARLRIAMKDEANDTIVVTLPHEWSPLDSDRHRSQFEKAVVEGGGQLCFVDYAGSSVTQRRLDEERFRLEFQAAMDTGLREDYPLWSADSLD